VVRYRGCVLCVWVCACACVCVRMLLDDAQWFLQLAEVDTIVRCASVACTMLHPEAQSSALAFLSVLTDVADVDSVSFSISTGWPKKWHTFHNVV